MCQSCVGIDKRVERHLELLRATTDRAERIECSCIKTRNGRQPQLAGPSGSFAILRAIRRASSRVRPASSAIAA
jgi:hypothetical protein